jgi:ATP-dependent Clp protease ATP-binding subunit ClpA
MFERFTDRARRVVVAAQEEARMLGHNHIGSEHLLLGLLHERDGTAGRVLAEAGITAGAARAQVEEFAGPGTKTHSGHIPFTQRARKVLELSLREALEQKSRHIGTEHILLAMTRDPGDVGAQILERLGESLPALRQRVLEEAKAEPGPAAERERGTEQDMWVADWRHAKEYAREARVPPQPVMVFRPLLETIDQRLAGIERQLGIVAGEEAPGGFRALLASVDRHLDRIERHLGITAEAATGEEGPAASAE